MVISKSILRRLYKRNDLVSSSEFADETIIVHCSKCFSLLPYNTFNRKLPALGLPVYVRKTTQPGNYEKSILKPETFYKESLLGTLRTLETKGKNPRTV